ncbi:hypothetical protein GCWB2_11135 [Gordonia rubripertincta]|nr:hypothetical protein GCWB2_11135 [Gordonia rubripertincta]
MFTDTNEWLSTFSVNVSEHQEARRMVALIVGLFAPVGLTVFTIGMDRFQRRMEHPGNRAQSARRSLVHCPNGNP